MAADLNTTRVVHNGMEVPLFKKKGHPSPFSVRDLNLLVRILRSWVNPQVRLDPAGKSKIELSDSNVVFTIGAQPGTPSGGGGITQCTLQVMHSDYLECVDGTGATVLVAKPPKLRNSITTENIFGVTATYMYNPGPDSLNVMRNYTDTDGIDEDQMVTPIWIADDVVYAGSCDHTGVIVDGVELTAIMVGEERMWMRI